jgi:IclR family transcriptional regulator, acetate operon repressor
VADRPVRPNYPITSADNVLRVLLMFRERDTVRVTEVSEALGVAHSTAHRLLSMLVYRSLVHHEPRRRTYHPGVGLVALAHSVLRHNTIGELAQPVLDALAAEVGETAHLTVMHGSDVIFVAVAEGQRAVRAAARTGTTLPVHRTAAGRALLTRLSSRDLDTILAAIESRGERIDRPQLLQTLDRERQSGYSVNRAETEPDLWAVAAPVVSGDVGVASITVGCPASRANEEWVRLTGKLVVDAAQQLAGRLEAEHSEA